MSNDQMTRNWRNVIIAVTNSYKTFILFYKCELKAALFNIIRHLCSSLSIETLLVWCTSSAPL